MGMSSVTSEMRHRVGVDAEIGDVFVDIDLWLDAARWQLLKLGCRALPTCRSAPTHKRLHVRMRMLIFSVFLFLFFTRRVRQLSTLQAEIQGEMTYLSNYDISCSHLLSFPFLHSPPSCPDKITRRFNHAAAVCSFSTSFSRSLYSQKVALLYKRQPTYLLVEEGNVTIVGSIFNQVALLPSHCALAFPLGGWPVKVL